MGVTHLVFDLARETRSVTALTIDGPAPRATRTLQPYRLYLCAHAVVSGEPIAISDVITRLGINYDRDN
jgi:hypothetical protein